MGPKKTIRSGKDEVAPAKRVTRSRAVSASGASGSGLSESERDDIPVVGSGGYSSRRRTISPPSSPSERRRSLPAPSDRDRALHEAATAEFSGQKTHPYTNPSKTQMKGSKYPLGHPKRPRTRRPAISTKGNPLDFESEGDSDSAEGWFFRSLRKDEPNPMVAGLRPPASVFGDDGKVKEHNRNIPITRHIISGTADRNEDKSDIVSGTRSRKVGASWAHSVGGGRDTVSGENKDARVVKAYVPRKARVDFTDPDDVAKFDKFSEESGGAPKKRSNKDVMQSSSKRSKQKSPGSALGSTGMNTAKSSQEVHVRYSKHAIPPQHIKEVYRPTIFKDKAAYEEAKMRAGEDQAHRFFATRRKKEDPVMGYDMGVPEVNPGFDPTYVVPATESPATHGDTPYKKGGAVLQRKRVVSKSIKSHPSSSALSAKKSDKILNMLM